MDSTEEALRTIEFLRVQLDELAASADDGVHLADCNMVARFAVDRECDCSGAAFLLADIEAKRKIIAELQATLLRLEWSGSYAVREAGQIILRLLAEPFADRADRAPRQAESELPAGWYHRHGDGENGRRFLYCEARGPARAHCLRPDHGPEVEHQWDWFTDEDRAKAEQALSADQRDGGQG